MTDESLIAKLDELIAATRSAAIPANMRWLSAESMAELLHVYGATFSDLDAANIELAKARAEATKWECLYDELYAEIASEHRRDEYGETETAAECVGRSIRERDQLRAQLDEYERAPQPPHVDPDWLANVIRTVDGDHAMGAGTLAEKIADAINGRTK